MFRKKEQRAFPVKAGIENGYIAGNEGTAFRKVLHRAKIESEKRKQLDALIRACNEESGLHIRIRYDDPTGFDSRLAHYGKFQNVDNYIILAEKPSRDLQEKRGYYGEKIVLIAGMGPYTKIDLGIVKYHFEVASGHKVK